MDNDNTNIAYLVAILVMVGSAFFTRGEVSKNFKALMVWIVIIGLVVGVTIYWGDFKNTKFYAGLVSGEGAKNNDGSVTYMRADDGHFHINAEIEGTNIRFMVDTGASSIVLNQIDAKKVGIDVDNLTYDRVYTTANGRTRGASVMLKTMVIGGQVINNVPASVNEGELDSSLLGMSFLDRLKSYRIEGNSLIIQP